MYQEAFKDMAEIRERLRSVRVLYKFCLNKGLKTNLDFEQSS